MGYYVLGDQGQKYGPADIDTLNAWIAEGRIVSTSMLEDAASGMQLAASSVQGLRFAPTAPPPAAPQGGPTQNPYQQPPYQQSPYQQPQQPNYYTQTQSQDNGPIILAFALAVISPILSFLLPIGGLFTALWGIRTAARARENGHPLGILAIAACVVAICLWVVFRIFGLGRVMTYR